MKKPISKNDQICFRKDNKLEAQKQIVNVARKLSDDGTIVLAGRGGEEMV